MNSPEAKHPTLTVGEFYTRHSEALQMKLLGSNVGFDRRIREPTINRPGLALVRLLQLLRRPSASRCSAARSFPICKSLARGRSARPLPARSARATFRASSSRAARSRPPALLEAAEAAGHRRLSHADGHDEVHQRRHARAGVRLRADEERIRQHDGHHGRRHADPRVERHRQKRVRARPDRARPQPGERRHDALPRARRARNSSALRPI